MDEILKNDVIGRVALKVRTGGFHFSGIAIHVPTSGQQSSGRYPDSNLRKTIDSIFFIL